MLWDLSVEGSFEIHPYRYNVIGWLTDLLTLQVPMPVVVLGGSERFVYRRKWQEPSPSALSTEGDGVSFLSS